MNYIILGLISLVLTLFILIVITPTNKDGKLNKVFQFLHNFFNFKKLYITLIIKAIVIFCTVLSVVVGIRLLFGISYYGYYKVNTFWYGLLLIVFGPISVRLSYEILWLTITSAQAIIQIRDKMFDKKETAFETDFDDELNAAEKFGNKVYESTKKFSSEAIEAAGKKINEYKESKQNKDTDSKEDNSTDDNQ